MLDLPTDQPRAGIIFVGEDPFHNLAFVVCCGLDFGDPQLEIFTCTGGIDSSKLNLPHPKEDPNELRAQVIDRNARLTDQNKTHNIEEIESRFRPFLDNHLDDIAQQMRNRDKEQVREFLENRVKDNVYFSKKLQFSSFFVEYNELVMEEDNESSQELNREEESGTDLGDDVRVLNISPELSAVKGGEVRQLEPGTEVMVRLAGEDAKLMGSGENQEQMDPFPAQVVLFREHDRDEDGTLRVKIQEGIHGECDVPGGSRIRQKDPPETEDSYEENLQSLTWVVTALMGLLIAISLLIFL